MSVTALAMTVPQAFQATARAHAHAPAIRARHGGVDWSWHDYHGPLRRCAAGLNELGGRRGDTLASWLTNRPEFHGVDTAAAHLGIASFSIYPTYTPEQAAHVIGDAGARILVTETALLDRALAVRARGTTALETIVCVEGRGEATLGWEELLAGGSDRSTRRRPRAPSRRMTC